MPGLKKIRDEAWKFYQEWRKEKTYSPAFKSKIRISLKGCAHLSGSDKAKLL